MKSVLRRLSADDLPEYSALLRQGLVQHPECFRIAPSDLEDAPAIMASEDSFTLGAFSEAGALVGIVSFARERRQKMHHKGLLFRMLVAKEAAGQGVGRSLVRECVAQARHLPGLEAVVLTVVSSNTAARRLYASEGFVSFALEPQALKHGTGYLDEEQMRLDLRSA